MTSDEIALIEMRLTRIQAATAEMCKALEDLFQACAYLPIDEMDRMEKEIEQARKVLGKVPPAPRFTGGRS